MKDVPNKKEKRFIKSSDEDTCAFCGSHDVSCGGSWSCPGCRNCGAAYYFDGWLENANEVNYGNSKKRSR